MILQLGASFEITSVDNQFITGTPCVITKIQGSQISYKKYPNHCVSESEKDEIKVIDKESITLIKSFY